MKKIKLLTFSASYSFGAMLQCYALCKVLSGMGYDIELLKVPLAKPDYGFIGNLTNRINALIVGQFKRKWLPPLVTIDENQVNADDIYIVGSDQVWNTSLTRDVALDYFLGFLPNDIKRIAYAASFGNSEWDNDRIEKDVFACLQKFTAISVRERSGISICKDIFNVNSRLALDPTLLLDNYHEFVEPKTNKKRKMVVFSLLDKKTPEFFQLIRFIGKQTNTRPVMLAERRVHKEITNIPWVTVEQWVSHIANSHFVITDSFHCTVFAIIHRKQFIAMPADIKRVGRILDLLDSLGLSDRYYPDIDSVYKTKAWMLPIDYDVVFERLSVLKTDSIEFLQTSIEK